MESKMKPMNAVNVFVKALITLSIVFSAASGIAHAKTLKWAFSGDIRTLDPHAHSESFTSSFLHHIYEPLVRRDQDLKFEPALAESYKLIEPTIWRFNLRKGVTFHNGNPFNADDVVTSINRATHPDSRARGNLLSIAKVIKVDEFTVDIVTKGPYPLLLNDLVGMFMLDQEWLEANNALMSGNMDKGISNYASTHTNGTGPFELISHKPDTKAVLKVNSIWWDTPQHNLTEIVFTPIASDATRVAALLSGQIDMMYPAPLQDVKRIEASSGFKVLQEPSLRVIMLGLNQKDDMLHVNKEANPLKDLRVRKALYQAINMDLIRKHVMRGKSRNSGLLVAPAVPGYSESLDTRLPHDIDAAKKLLADAGFPNGFNTGFDCPNDRYVNDEEICVAITGMWSEIGVKAELVAQTKSKHFKKVFNGGSDIYMLGWATLPQMDAISVLSSLLASPSDTFGGDNAGGYSNKRLDELTQLVVNEVDENKRRAMMTEALKIARDEIAMIPLHEQPNSWAMRANVEIPMQPDSFLRLWLSKVQ